MTVFPRKQKGVALGYLLGLVALLAVLGAVIAQDSDIKQDAIKQKRATDALVAQALIIRNGLFLCQVSYPAGGASGGTDNRFPASTADIRNAECPGTPGVTVFSGVSDVSYPKRIDGFSEWALTNDGTGVSITATMDNASDSNAQKAMALAVQELGTWQTSTTATAFTYFLKQ